MKLNFSQIKDITLGAVRIEEVDNAVHFYRFTKHQQELYKERNAGFYRKTFASSGVKMRFRTDSQSVFMNVDVSSGSSRRYFCIEVLANGKRVGALKNFNDSQMVGNFTKTELPFGNFSESISLGAGEKEVCIYFPWSVETVLNELSIDDGSFIEPVTPAKKLLVFGDSITQGYDALYPSNKYITRIAEMLDAQEHNKAIGGEIYFPELAKSREDFDPDYILVSYGSNDWNKCTKEKLTQNCKEFYRNLNDNYPNAKIFVITPIWRKDMNESRPGGDFMSVAQTVQNQATEFPNISVIYGFDLVPQDEALFADLSLHPNDKGFDHHFENLSKKIKDILQK